MMTCNQYDYIELVCLYRFPIKLTLKSGEIISGIAVDTCRNTLNQHCIKLISETNSQQDSSEQAGHLVELDNISHMHVCIDNPHVRDISFD
ncbi:Rho-binding antiterminator [Shewanella sp. 1CM18E]|uniref:Rho-binding antiterminator n=1 Tax=Shewanella sp. 1CM18E TaxID=2929169 RepID=UPI0020BD9B09|nr:Rho-binding antiterminator [Shewanella sp. 1CM18E]MCK8044206.1 Rho-binding antiterminator [Shewanella sp. 1CM18E]